MAALGQEDVVSESAIYFNHGVAIIFCINLFLYS